MRGSAHFWAAISLPCSESRCGLALSDSSSRAPASASRACWISFSMASVSRATAPPRWSSVALTVARSRPAGGRRLSCPSVTADTRLAPGQPAPDFSLTSDRGETVSLGDFRGHRVLVYFYPAAGTPGCTKEACDFRDNLTSFNDADVTVLGISPDKPEKLAKFRDEEGLTFPLLSDADRAVMQAWGARGGQAGGGRRGGKAENRKPPPGRHPLAVPGRPGRDDRGGAVRGQGHRP